MEKKKSNHLAVCIICGVLTAFGIVANIISLITGGKGIWMANNVIDILVSILIGYYAFSGYRKPHGNLLKYIILIFTVTYFLAIYQLVQLKSPWMTIIFAISIGLNCYVAGRLHRVKQNMVLMSILAVLRFITMILSLSTGVFTIGAISPIIIWIDIFVAYVLRYKEHKEAGLADAPKQEI